MGKLLEDGANPNIICHPRGWSALHAAASVGDDVVCDQLLSFKARHDLADIEGMTPLHAASIRGHADAIRSLVQSNANVNTTDKYGRTPLFLAGFHGQRAAADVLIDYGADTLGAEAAMLPTPWSREGANGKNPSLTLGGGQRLCQAGASVVAEKALLTPSVGPMKAPLRKTLQLGHDLRWLQLGGVRQGIPSLPEAVGAGQRLGMSSSLPELAKARPTMAAGINYQKKIEITTGF